MDWDIPACHPGYQMQPSLPPVSPLILSSRICPPLPPPPTQGPTKHCQDFFLQNPLSHTSPCSQYSSIPHSDSLLDEHEWVPSLSSFRFGHSYGPIHVLKQEIYLGSWGHQRLMHSFCLIPFPNSPSLSFPPISSSNKSVLHSIACVLAPVCDVEAILGEVSMWVHMFLSIHP